MSAQGSTSNLTQASRNLLLDWETTKTYWRDVKSQEFEQNYLADLPNQVTAAINAMQELELFLKKVRNECE